MCVRLVFEVDTQETLHISFLRSLELLLSFISRNPILYLWCIRVRVDYFTNIECVYFTGLPFDWVAFIGCNSGWEDEIEKEADWNGIPALDNGSGKIVRTKKK